MFGLAGEEGADCFEFQRVIIDEEGKVVFLFLELLLGLEHRGKGYFVIAFRGRVGAQQALLAFELAL